MNYRFLASSATTTAVLCTLIGASVGCRKTNRSDQTEAAIPSHVSSELLSNKLATLPGAIYRNQAHSPIHWQPWTRETLDRAKSANRLVFAVIALPQQANFQSVLAALTADPTLVSAINRDHVPVLIDGEASRETGLLTADLCAEIKRGLQLPLFVWMTPDGNPVAWIPVPKSSPATVLDLFNKSYSMVSRMWSDDSSYVLKNSASDNANRANRIAQRKNANVLSQQPAEDTIRSLRQLTSFYDPYSRSFDEAGGLFPSGTLDLIASAAVHPGIAPEVRARCMDTTRDLLTDLLQSPMFDPLDGGVFASRRGNSWALPSFTRDCSAETRAAVALLHAYHATGNPLALEKALGVIAFTEQTYATSEGLFSVGLSAESDPAAWLWNIEEIEKELPPEDAAWWIKATGMKGLGNLPSEVDPQREYFRCNSIGLAQSPAQIAEGLSLPLATFGPRMEDTRKKLLKARNARLGQPIHDDCSYAPTTFRMVSAYAAAFAATGNEKFRQNAIALLEKSRIAFSDGPKLRLFSQDAPKSIGAGRAFTYGLALQAAIDVSVISSDPKWLDWSENLATIAAELFTDSQFLKECPDEAKVIDLPVTDLVMLFDDSTAGLISLAECRLSNRERTLVSTFSDLATPLPTYTVDRPILHTDLLLATIARHYRVTVVTGTHPSAALKLATERLSLRMFQRRNAKSADEVPADSVMIILPDGETRVVTTPEALQQAVLPSPAKS